MKIKNAILVLVLFFQCSTYVSGDLNSDNISSTEFPLDEVSIVEKSQLRPNEPIFFFPEDENKTYKEKGQLELDYIIPDEYEGGLCSILTMVTFGICPCYNNFKGIVKFKLKKENAILLDSEVSFRLHIFYGWLALGISSLIPEENQVGINEGTGINGAMIGIVRSRLRKRIQRLWEEKSSGK